MKIISILIIIMMAFSLGVSAQQEEAVKQVTSQADSASYYLSSGQKLAQEGKYEEALKSYQAAGKFDPNNEQAILGQMNMYFYLRRIDEGLKVIEDWTVSDPKNPHAWKTMADYFSYVGKTDKALTASEKLIVLQPDSASSWLLKAGILNELKQYEEVIAACDKASELDPLASDAWYLKAYALARMRKYDEAVVTSNTAIELFPGKMESYYTRACIYAVKGDADNSLIDLKKCIAMDSSVKERAMEDTDFKSLYKDARFQELTGMSKAEADEYLLADSVCGIADKAYKSKAYLQKISGSWKADRAYIHGENLLGERNFFFTFKPDGNIEIKEPERNFDVTGTWKIGDKTNTLEWTVPDKNVSFRGKYDFLGNHLVISGQGFVGEFENVCLRLILQ